MSSYSNKHNSLTPITSETHEEEIDLKAVLATLLRYKHSIGFIVTVAFILSVIVVYFKPNIYQADATVQIGSSEAKSRSAYFSSMLGVGGGNLDDEMAIIQSRSVAQKALENLSLGTRYFTSKRLKTIELYKDAPFSVKTEYIADVLMGQKIVLEPLDENHFELSSHPTWATKVSYLIRSLIGSVPEEEIPIDFEGTFSYGAKIKTPFISFTISKNDVIEREYYFTIVPDAEMYTLIQSSLSVASGSMEGEILSLSFQDTVPLRAEEALNAVIKAYERESVEVKIQSAQKTLGFIDKQLQAIDDTLERSATNLKNYKTAHAVIDVGGKATSTVQKLDKFETQRSDLQIQESVLNNLLIYLKNNNEMTGIDVGGLQGGGSPILSLIEKINSEKMHYTALTVDYTDNHPSVIKSAQQIAALKANLKGTLESSLRGVRQRLSTLNEIISKNNESLANLPEEEQQLTRLIGSFSFNQKTYEYLLQQRAETAIAQSSVVSEARIVDDAIAYDTPVAPKRSLMVMIGIILGFIVGIAQAFVRNYLSDTIQSIGDIEKHTMIPLYSVLPFFKDRKTLYEDALRVLLTKFEFSPTKPQVITITSSVQGEGRTTTAIEFAQVIGQSGKKVVVLDMDLRGSGINNKLHLGSRGMSALLEGSAEFEELVHYVAPNTDVVVSGFVPSDPYKLIMSDRFEALLEKLRETYDYIILESPPAGLVADSLVLMRLSDLNLVVFKAGHSKKGFIESMNRFVQEHRLDNVAIILNGLALNKIRPWQKNS